MSQDTLDNVQAAVKEAIRQVGEERFWNLFKEKEIQLQHLCSKTVLLGLTAMDFGVEVNMSDELNGKGKLESLTRLTSKKNKPYFKLVIATDAGQLIASCWDPDKMGGVSEGDSVQFTYTQNKVGPNTYNNISSVSVFQGELGFVPGTQVQQKKLPVEDPSQDHYDLAGAKNNATTLLAAVISTAENPAKALDVMREMLTQGQWQNLTKTLYTEIKAVRKSLNE